MGQEHNLGGQLRMFIPAGELKATASPLPGDYWEFYDPESGLDWSTETKGELWERKTVESRMSAAAGGIRRPFKKGLYKSIQEGGVREPIRLVHDVPGQDSPVIAQGHHRIAAAADIDPDMLVPVEHYDLPESGRTNEITWKPGEKNMWHANDVEWDDWIDKVSSKLGRNY